MHLGNLIPAFRRHITQTCWLDVTWSLAVEEHFYLVWPLVVISCSRLTAMRVAAGAVVAAPLIRVGLAALGSPPVPVYVLTPGRIDALGARLDGRIDAQSARIDAQTARIDAQTARIDGLTIALHAHLQEPAG